MSTLHVWTRTLGGAHLSAQRAVARRESLDSPFPRMRFIAGGELSPDLHGGRDTVQAASTVRVDPFWIDATPVTNWSFAQFVRATGYVTLAETPLNPASHAGAPNDLLRPGSIVFSPGRERADLHDWSNWWSFRFGACWRRPYGANSSIVGLDDHPVVHIAYEDAAAYARWAGKELPSEAEWELAARGGLIAAEYAWGNEFMPGQQFMANTWQGAFPFENTGADGYRRTSPVKAFPPNGYGVYDMIGNVWEWTTTAARANGANACCPGGQRPRACIDHANGAVDVPGNIIKGGSFLSAPNWCASYHPASRHVQLTGSAACHIGFRCLVRK